MAPAATLPHPLPAAPVPPRVPSTLHVGSGKKWVTEWLNLDVEPRWQPDVVYDLNQPLPAGGQVTLPSARFGDITLGEGVFEAIVAQDVLEHVRDLTTAMTTMLHWLRPGGVLQAAVPYELSLGAWCDPTHVRAFNERSFVYYCEWSWYLGWRTHHFRTQKLEFVPTEYGRELLAAGMAQDEVVRTPRAIEQMYVELVKQSLSPEAQRITEQYLAPARPSPSR